jgi:hypothetical protein
MDDAEKPAAGISEEAVPLKRWQPFTPRGVASSANASSGSIFFAQLAFAIAATAVVMWFLQVNYFPAILDSIRHLPDTTTIQNGRLIRVSSQVLSQRKFLSFIIDLEETGRLGEISDIKVELRPDYFQICSIFGCAMFNYPQEKIPIGRSSAEPWWGARQPVIFAILALVTLVALWLSWLVFAFFYAIAGKLVAAASDRQLSWSESWKMALAAQMLPALLMSVAILFYGLQVFDLIQFLFFFGAHFFVAWVYLGTALFLRPCKSHEKPENTNPFSGSDKPS